MTAPFASPGLHDALILLAAAGLVIPAFATLRISPVIGFILVGIVVGPHGIGGASELPGWLRELAITDPHALEPLAEIGVAMLLFALGLELSTERLRTLRRYLLTLGLPQLLLCAAALLAVLLVAGIAPVSAASLAFALALSSTAVGLQLLMSQGRLDSHAGRDAFAMLLFQDIAIAPILLLIAASSAPDGFGLTLLRGVLAIAAIVIVGKFALRPLFLQAARTRSHELFLAAALVVIIGAAAVTASVGLSPVIGALAAGIMLAETEYRRQIEATIAPFQGLLLGLFLVYTGMRLDLGAIAAQPWLVLGAVAAVVGVKVLVIAAWLKLRGRSNGVAAHVALLLAAPSETGLVVLAAAVAAGAIAGPLVELALLVIALGLALAPLLGLAGGRIEAWLAGMHAIEAPLPVEPTRTILIGFGRVGQMVADMLDRHNRPWLAVESDPDAVVKQRALGRPVIYGDARRHELLERLDLDRAAAVVLTIHATESLDVLARAIRRDHPNLCLIARARDAEHAARLYRIGVTDAVPETIEASLQLAEAVLVDLGVPMGPVIASIHEKRAELRAEIEQPDDRPTLGRRRLRDV
ncbi:sodium:proton exchanger [Polymorphobacter arshaanensis]|uniref:Sodium:proton exchanger n=1 Tax=Glacieibacterium arshaanense TaxID=2511025 RepID=A0A4Y9ENU5_9SPHN|nr:cation:proton antiporter [Polymorphobacter arshaanensis]TFU03746.1 sodium:proton exchanger [Polymorphobacter arshaanensis]